MNTTKYTNHNLHLSAESKTIFTKNVLFKSNHYFNYSAIKCLKNEIIELKCLSQGKNKKLIDKITYINKKLQRNTYLNCDGFGITLHLFVQRRFFSCYTHPFFNFQLIFCLYTVYNDKIFFITF